MCGVWCVCVVYKREWAREEWGVLSGANGKE